MSIRIMIVDDHAVMREGLRSLLLKSPDCEVVAEAGDGREAVDLAAELKPDIIIMDISMPGMNGIEAARLILENTPEAKLIALSMYSDRRFVDGILSAGASGYLVKDCAFDELYDAISTVTKGGVYLCSRVEDDLNSQNSSGRRNDSSNPESALSKREREVLGLVAEGNSTKEIAAKLSISVKTVDSHRQSLMRKLNIRDVANLTKYALRKGLTDLDRFE